MVFRMVKNLDRSYFRIVTINAFDRRTDGHLSHRYSALAFHTARKKRLPVVGGRLSTSQRGYISHVFRVFSLLYRAVVLYGNVKRSSAYRRAFVVVTRCPAILSVRPSVNSVSYRPEWIGRRLEFQHVVMIIIIVIYHVRKRHMKTQNTKQTSITTLLKTETNTKSQFR